MVRSTLRQWVSTALSWQIFGQKNILKLSLFKELEEAPAHSTWNDSCAVYNSKTGWYFRSFNTLTTVSKWKNSWENENINNLITRIFILFHLFSHPLALKNHSFHFPPLKNHSTVKFKGHKKRKHENCTLSG